PLARPLRRRVLAHRWARARRTDCSPAILGGATTRRTAGASDFGSRSLRAAWRRIPPLPARLPDLLIIGAPKAGTTTLSHWLREPVARAWSQYWFFRMLGLEPRSWDKVVEQDRDGDRTGYLWRGQYAEQLDRWDAAVGAERMHVDLLEDLAAHPDETYARLCR